MFTDESQIYARKKRKDVGEYHKLHTSSDFKLEWKKLLEVTIKTISVHFYQHITHKIFLELLYLEFPLEVETDEDGPSDALITTEYVAGYVCRKVKDNLQSAHCTIPNKQSMIQCLLDISSNTSDDLDCEESVNMVNRGRLWRINDDVYGVL